MRKIIVTHTAAETEALGQTLAKKLRSGDVLAFRGGLGAGKTTLVQGLAKGLGVGGEVASPTFALVHEYPGSPPLYHFDLYRIHEEEDLYATGFYDYLDQGGILAIEWSENVADFLPDDAIIITIRQLDLSTREFTIDGDERF